MKHILYLLILTFIFGSCNRNPLKVDVSAVKVDLKLKHLDVDLLKLSHDQIESSVPRLKNKYGEFFDIFTYRMITIGGTETANFNEMLYSFVTDSLIRKLETKVAKEVDTVRLQNQLEAGFKHYFYYFPAKQVPQIFTCISGFNQSVVTSANLIGISLDKYLGSDSKFYDDLGLPAYKRRNMHPEKILSDVMYAWVLTEWPKEDNSTNLLSQMIYEGKMMYFVEAMLPDQDDTLTIGFTEKQIGFCKNNQAKMWTYLAEHKLLFTTDRMSIKRFIDEGPFTPAFTDESPGRTGIWLGWQIVRSYMKQNPETTLAELLNNQDFQGILNQSGYQP